MGLDMYLTREIYTFEDDMFTIKPGSKNNTDSELFKNLLTPTYSPFNTTPSITVTAIYWRKSNAIHHWFVENVQDDNDDCGSYCVTIESLEELRDICQNVIDKHENTYSQEVLPTETGFFFGDTDINQHYYEDVKRTADALNKELLLTKKIAGTKLEIEYSYQASW